MIRNALVSVLLRLTPSRWRDSVAGDFAEAPDGLPLTVWHGARVVSRLWIEEVFIRRDTPPRRFKMQATGFQLREAVRALRNRPAYSLIVILTLAVGIGANAAVFGLANWLMFREVPAVHDPDRLVTVRLVHASGAVFTISHPEMRTVLEHTPGLASLAGAMEASLHVATETAPAERVPGAIVSANYFDVLGMRPSRGTFFSETHPGVIVSHAFWMTHLSASENVPGSTVMVNGQRLAVLGVAPKGFTGASRSATEAIWVPSTLRTVVFPGYKTDPLTNMAGGIYVTMVGRLAPGASVEQARNS